MEVLVRTTVERVLFLTCCLIVVPTITTPTEDLGPNYQNAVPVSTFHYPGDDPSNWDNWNYGHPRFSIQQLEEQKRRSSFFPVRGKKGSQNIYHAQSETPAGHSVDNPEATNTNGRTFLPAVYDFSHKGSSYSQRSANEPQEGMEGALDLTSSSNWPAVQKRPSSFMPMRGRKRYTNGNNLELLKRYLAARGHSARLAYGGTAPNPRSFSGGKTNPTKRALSFVPTRGRREKSQELVPEFLPHVAASETVADWPEDSPSGQVAKNLSRHIPEEDGKSHQKSRRASAFLPVRGRKSGGTPYWIAYDFLPWYIDHLERSGDLETPGTEKLAQLDYEDSDVQELMLDEDAKEDVGGRRQKKHFGGKELQPSVSQQELRTAVVVKRPMSFFAARGKRWDGGRTGIA